MNERGWWKEGGTERGDSELEKEDEGAESGEGGEGSRWMRRRARDVGETSEEGEEDEGDEAKITGAVRVGEREHLASKQYTIYRCTDTLYSPSCSAPFWLRTQFESHGNSRHISVLL